MEASTQHIKVKVLPALGGDCFFISYYDEGSERHLLLDFGYATTFQHQLKNVLQIVKDKGQVIERAIVTHIDADHIAGGIAFLKSSLADITIKDFWHNAYRHIQPESSKLDIDFDTKQRLTLKAIIAKGMPSDNTEIRTTIGAEQGSTLGSLILEHEKNWNNDFGGKAVSLNNVERVQVTKNASIFLLSPNDAKLAKLQSIWVTELSKYGLKETGGGGQLLDDAFEMLLLNQDDFLHSGAEPISSRSLDPEELIQLPFTEDNTETNGSSIAFILSIYHFKLLFLGDSHPSLILQSLDKYSPEISVQFDLIKISHHGSYANTSPELLQKMDSPRYLISTNGGRHGHPDKETIAHIITRPTAIVRTLFFNYQTETSKYFDRKEWMEKYSYRIEYLDHSPYDLKINS